jgi:cell division topological specificity factor
MSLFSFFKARGTAPVARERLQILLAHERITLGPRNLISILRDEILAAIAKHVEIAPEAIKVTMGQSGAVATLEIDVEVPTEKIGARSRQEPTLGSPAAASR